MYKKQTEEHKNIKNQAKKTKMDEKRNSSMVLQA
jgi:hypothetical protein